MLWSLGGEGLAAAARVKGRGDENVRGEARGGRVAGKEGERWWIIQIILSIGFG
jgi:hypothetical protein